MRICVDRHSWECNRGHRGYVPFYDNSDNCWCLARNKEMKFKEYKNELDALLAMSQKLNERLAMQEKTSEWLIKRSDDICKKLDSADDLSFEVKEKLMHEAYEIAGRLTAEMKSIQEDFEMDKKIKDRLDKISRRRIKEGLELE